MGTRKLGGDQPLPEPTTRKRPGTTLGVAPAPAPPAQVCAKCQTSIPSGASFCGECGGSVFTDVQTPAAAHSQVAAGMSPQTPPAPAPIVRPAPVPLSTPAPAKGRRRPKGIGTLMGDDMAARIKLAEETRGFKIFLISLAFVALFGLVIWVITSTPSRRPSAAPPASSVNISIPLTDANTED